MIRAKEEYKNGFIIFLLLGLFFLIIDLAGLSDVAYLRVVNIAFILFGVNLTLKQLSEKKENYLKLFTSGMITALFGIVLSLIGLFIYMQITGAEISEYSTTIIPTTNMSRYFLVLFAEGLSSSIIAVFALMQYWKAETVSNADIKK